MPRGAEDAGWRRSLWLLGGAALLLRLFDLGRQDLWVDEGITWFYARNFSLAGLGELIRGEPTPPLYYALVAAWTRLLGDSDLVLRLPSALAGALAPPLLALLGDRLGWRRAGLCGGVLLALHPWHLFLSREARVYPLLLTLALALALALRRALEDGARRSWLAASLLLALTLYSHLFGLFVGAAAFAAVALLARSSRERLRGLGFLGGALLLFAPYLWLAGPGLAAGGASWSQELFFDALPAEGGLPRIFEGQLVGARYHLLQRELAVPETPPLLRWPAIAVQGLLLVLASWRARRAPEERRGFLFLGLFYLLPFVLPWAAGLATGQVFLQPGRHDFAALGPLCLLLGLGWEELARRSRALAVLALLPIAAGGLSRLVWLHLVPAEGISAARGAYLAEAAAPGDLAVAFGIERLLGERYTRLHGGDLVFESFPAETDRHPGWSDPRPLLRKLPELAGEARERTARQRGRGRILVLLAAAPGAAGPPGGAIGDVFLRALEQQGWRLEGRRDDLRVLIWRYP